MQQRYSDICNIITFFLYISSSQITEVRWVLQFSSYELQLYTFIIYQKAGIRVQSREVQGLLVFFTCRPSNWSCVGMSQCIEMFQKSYLNRPTFYLIQGDNRDSLLWNTFQLQFHYLRPSQLCNLHYTDPQQVKLLISHYIVLHMKMLFLQRIVMNDQYQSVVDAITFVKSIPGWLSDQIYGNGIVDLHQMSTKYFCVRIMPKYRLSQKIIEAGVDQMKDVQGIHRNCV
ncbi:Hypothetical_protein [Hexamita inflata]|uniref:Hypothetical_protein n=1 Tax=Hexamita inflata TaxID=28002 RepID=A0AA86N9E7_9EUKA|nr:Hypothetical protein HINF_LOCUS2900 [Hexamita inflata]